MISAMKGGRLKKRKFKFEKESSKKMKKYHSSTLEQLCLRFPLLEDKILKELDYQSLIRFTTASQEMADIQQRSRLFWIRRMQHRCGSMYVGNNEKIAKEWRKVIEKSPMEIVRELYQTTIRFYSFSTKKRCCIVRYSPLHIAADRGNLRLCQHIMNRIADKNPKDLVGETPFHFAAEEGHYKVCELILENNSDKNPKDDRGFTPLHGAAMEGHLDLCKLIIQNANDKNPANNFGRTPLHSVARLGYDEICKIIIEKAEDKNPGDSNGCTPLHIAALDNRLECCKIIVDMVDNKNPANLLGQTPLHWAAAAGNFEIFQLIFLKVNDKNPFDIDGYTPLYMAASNGHLEILKFIMERVKDKSPVNNYGFTPLDGAACFGHFNICKFIIENMTDVTPEEWVVRLKSLIRKILSATLLKNKKNFEILFWSLLLQKGPKALNPRPLTTQENNSKVLFLLNYCTEFIVNNS